MRKERAREEDMREERGACVGRAPGGRAHLAKGVHGKLRVLSTSGGVGGDVGVRDRVGAVLGSCDGDRVGLGTASESEGRRRRVRTTHSRRERREERERKREREKKGRERAPIWLSLAPKEPRTNVVALQPPR